MVKSRYLVFSLIVASIICIPPVEANWKFKKKAKGIEVYIRNVPGTGLKEFKGVMYIKGARLSSFVGAFDDTESYTRWMHKCIQSKLIKYINPHERITYTVTDAPWPFKDRDTVVYSLIRQNPEDYAVTISITGKPDFIPRKEPRIRIPVMKAQWTFKPLKSGTVKVMYQVITDPGGWLPLKIMNISMIDLPLKTMHKLKSIVKKGRYSGAVFDIIKEPKQ